MHLIKYYKAYKKKKMKTFSCSICDKEVTEFGNNPQPVISQSGKPCCDECNTKYVIPARIFMYQLHQQIHDNESTE